MKFADLWGKRLVFFDGAMGTMLQQAGLKGGELPELMIGKSRRWWRKSTAATARPAAISSKPIRLAPTALNSPVPGTQWRKSCAAR